MFSSLAVPVDFYLWGLVRPCAMGVLLVLVGFFFFLGVKGG
jgi:hypothetical protein